MRFGVFTVGDIAPDPVTGYTYGEAEFRGSRLEDHMEHTPLTVGSPQQVIDKVRTFQEGFGDCQRQLFAVDSLALPVDIGLEQVELLGTDVVPVLRKELEPRPNPNRGDNLSGTSPYQDSDPTLLAHYPVVF